MNPILIVVIAVGVSIIGLILVQSRILRTEFRDLRKEFRSEFENVRGEIKDVGAELKTDRHLSKPPLYHGYVMWLVVTAKK